MKFGKVDNPAIIDFTLPKDHPGSLQHLSKYPKTNAPKVYVGCAKWNRADLKGFYPKGTKDELEYYSRQFNSIELNATFYRIFPETTFQSWYEKTPDNFRFFPKMYQGISHWKRLKNFEDYLDEYLLASSALKEKLEMPFVQTHSNFSPQKNMDRLEPFFKAIPKDLKIAIEFRHPDWFNDPIIANELYDLMESYNISNILVDTAGRRDIMHMRMTTDTAFIRYNGANHDSDYARLDNWVNRLEEWVKQGLQNIYFFVHQNIEKASPLLSAYFIEKMNKRLGCNINTPSTPAQKLSLFP